MGSDLYKSVTIQSRKQYYIHAPHIHNNGNHCCGSESSISSESEFETVSESRSKGFDDQKLKEKKYSWKLI
jgi:hypothetical protein